jgi:phage/plasmid-associated DNA primase
MRDFTDSVRADRDAAGSFVDDCVKHEDGEFVTAGDLYKAFVKYCKANGIDPILNSTAFGRQVKRCEVDGQTMERRKGKVQGIRRFNDIVLHDVPDVDDHGNHFGGMPEQRG